MAEYDMRYRAQKLSTVLNTTNGPNAASRDLQRQPVESQEVVGIKLDSVKVKREKVKNSGLHTLNQIRSKVKRNIPDLTSDLLLSRNISLLLEGLLKNYNNHIRPGLTEGRITVVKLNMLIRSMGPINEKDMRYSMDCYLRQEWRDDRLRFAGPLQTLSLNINMLEALWKPDTFFRNGLGSYIHTITRPNKLFRIDQHGRILYSMRLTIKAKCPMELKNFPMDIQSCPLQIGSYAYPVSDVVYEWDAKLVSFESGMTLSQFDLLVTDYKNLTAVYKRGGGDYSTLQVNFILQRHTGYFLIQVYIPCILIVVLSWVSFWINREATSDRIGLGITTVLTLSTISLDTRTDLPKVHYATALDWFILMSFGYCIATLLQFAGVHYFTKIGSGEGLMDEDEDLKAMPEAIEGLPSPPTILKETSLTAKARVALTRHSRRRSQYDVFFSEGSRTESTDKMASLEVNGSDENIHQIETGTSLGAGVPECFRMNFYGGDGLQIPTTAGLGYPSSFSSAHCEQMRSTETQTEEKDSFCTQLYHCVLGNDEYRKHRQQQACHEGSVNSVSVIDRLSRVLFPASYGLLNLWYWYSYFYYKEADFTDHDDKYE